MRRISAIVGLLVLAPLVGEFLLGNLSVRLLPALPFLVPLYGAGALLVREVARRTGRGWPAILAMGAAYGVIEAGLVDQSMFNPTFEGHDFQAVTPVPALGLSAANTLAFVAGHAIWSITVPIAVVERLSGSRAPWLGRKGPAAVALLYLFGCRIVYKEIHDSEGYLAAPAQRLGALAAAVLLIVLALVPWPSVRSRWPAPRPWLAGAIAFVATTAYFVGPESWLGFGFDVAVLLAGAVWLARTRWAPGHHAALAGGALLTYAWAGFALTQLLEPGDPVRWWGNAALAAFAIALVVACVLRRAEPPAPAPPTAARSTA